MSEFNQPTNHLFLSVNSLLSLQHCEAIEKAQVEMQRLRVERERYEESMKKAFMRGVCALNIEALGIFQNADGRSDRTPVFDQQGLYFLGGCERTFWNAAYRV